MNPRSNLNMLARGLTAGCRIIAITIAGIAPALAVPAMHAAPVHESELIEFNRDIRPILSDKCFQCHGPDPATREAGLRLDFEDVAKADRGGYAAIVVGDPASSELVSRITSEDPSLRMPPQETKKPLTSREIELLRRWIVEGAEWELPWAYVPPRRAAAPVLESVVGELHWIDAFIRQRLHAEGLTPSPEADAVTLIRRLSIDLTGVPPTPGEVDRFLRDKHPDAYEHLVDSLLASPRFGERMAMYWLDLVRYADTTGYAGDQEHHISPYRDYVISAFNRNLTFDQFTREQLAGDLLPSPTLEQLIATGYNRLLQTSHEGGVQEKEYLAIYGADRVRNISAVWMGATVGCAQCHDHKYDPYTAKDFYALQAFFADVDEADHLRRGRDVSPTVRTPEIVVYSPAEQAELARLTSKLEQITNQPAPKRTAAPIGPAADQHNGQSAPLKEAAAVKSRIGAIQAGARRTMITVAITPRPIRVLPRGNWQDDSGSIVEPAVPEFLGVLNVGNRRADRLDLANWLTDAEQGAGGLTARVMANRFWYLLFGRGLSAVLDDFGGQGEPPDHPELLDALAVEFINSGWDVKRLIKEIALSRTYRQASYTSEFLEQRDPLNRLLARQGRYRYPAETIRDSLLAISGLLVEEIGGSSIRPYQPEGYYRHLNFPKRDYTYDADDRQWRRGVYVHWQRQFLHPMLKAFDAPSREECTAQRPRSNTPLAALVLLNDPSSVEAARAFSAHILKEGGQSIEERLEVAFRRAVSRSPDNREKQLITMLLKDASAEYAKRPESADHLLSAGQAARPPELAAQEHAAWTIVARAILSMNETLTRY